MQVCQRLLLELLPLLVRVREGAQMIEDLGDPLQCDLVLWIAKRLDNTFEFLEGTAVAELDGPLSIQLLLSVLLQLYFTCVPENLSLSSRSS